MTVSVAPLRGARRTLALAALLACAADAHAQTAPVADPYAPRVQQCMMAATAQPHQALQLAGELLAAEGLPGVARVGALGCRAMALHMSGQGAAALETVDRLLAASQEPGIPVPLRMNAQLQGASVLLASAGTQARALALMEDVLDESRRRGEPATTLNALMSIGGAHASILDDPAGALPYFEQAIELSRRLPRAPHMQEAGLHYNHAYALLRLGRHAEARQGFERALEIARAQPGQQAFADRVASHLGEIERATGDRGKARTLLESALAAQERSGDAHGQTVTRHRLAQLALDEGQLDLAAERAAQTLALAERGRFVIEIRDALELLATVHAARGEPAEAARYTQRIRAMERERDRAAGLEKLARMQAQVERETAPGNATAQDLGQARLLRNAALAALALVLAVGGVLLWRMRRRQRHLRELGSTDPLTGLPNRREADRRVTAMLAAHPGDGERRCVLLLVDVDAFKAINDEHGHATGDQALAHVARTLRAACDGEDVVARWGGEEFLVARADSSREAAFALAEQLRGAVARAPFPLPGGALLELTVSIGLAPCPFFPGAARPAPWQEALNMADRALYAAKDAGRNAWAGLWGLAGGQAGLREVRQDPEAALARGWIVAGGNRPVSWNLAREEAPEAAEAP